jgi:hypothetical protein
VICRVNRHLSALFEKFLRTSEDFRTLGDVPSATFSLR